VERWAQDDDEVAQGSFQGFSHASAAFLQAIGDQMGRKSEEWLRHIPTTPQTRLRFDQNGRVGVMFSRAEDFWLTVNGPVDTIINLGPGLTGARFAADISGRTQDIHYVSGDISAHFVNSWIELGLSAEATRQDGLRRAGRLAEKYFLPSDHDVRLPEAHFYDKGIAAAMRDIAQTLDKPADVIVMSAAHGTGPQECLASIRPDLLRPGGLWVVKAPLRSLDVTEAGFDVLAEPATAIFGTPIAFGPCGSMNQIIDPAQPAERPACYAIYQKQA
jgi:hypothetical protein